MNIRESYASEVAAGNWSAGHVVAWIRHVRHLITFGAVACVVVQQILASSAHTSMLARTTTGIIHWAIVDVRARFSFWGDDFFIPTGALAFEVFHRTASWRQDVVTFEKITKMTAASDQAVVDIHTLLGGEGAVSIAGRSPCVALGRPRQVGKIKGIPWVARVRNRVRFEMHHGEAGLRRGL